MERGDYSERRNTSVSSNGVSVVSRFGAISIFFDGHSYFKSASIFQIEHPEGWGCLGG